MVEQMQWLGEDRITIAQAITGFGRAEKMKAHRKVDWERKAA